MLTQFLSILFGSSLLSVFIGVFWSFKNLSLLSEIILLFLSVFFVLFSYKNFSLLTSGFIFILLFFISSLILDSFFSLISSEILSFNIFFSLLGFYYLYDYYKIHFLYIVFYPLVK